jgi:hypothetical protein
VLWRSLLRDGAVGEASTGCGGACSVLCEGGGAIVPHERNGDSGFKNMRCELLRADGAVGRHVLWGQLRSVACAFSCLIVVTVGLVGCSMAVFSCA